MYIKIDNNNIITEISSIKQKNYIYSKNASIKNIGDTYIAPSDAFKENIAPISKATSVSCIKVTTTGGKVFDGDEKAQDRMVRAITIAGVTGKTSTNWKLADNSIVLVTVNELKEALALAGQAMSDIWLK